MEKHIGVYLQLLILLLIIPVGYTFAVQTIFTEEDLYRGPGKSGFYFYNIYEIVSKLIVNSYSGTPIYRPPIYRTPDLPCE